MLYIILSLIGIGDYIMTKAMISHRATSAEKAIAVELNVMLLEKGVHTWIGFQDIHLGIRWEDVIFDAILSADVVIVCLSEGYYDSRDCLTELYFARAYQKKIIPVWVGTDPNFDAWTTIPTYEPTKGLEDLLIAHLHEGTFFGLNLTLTERLERIVDSVANPIDNSQKYEVFISYKSSESKYATQIAEDLNEADIPTFISTKHINVGDDWRTASYRPLIYSRFHIVILTPDIVESIYIKNEVRLSSTKQTEYIPIASPKYGTNPDSLRSLLDKVLVDDFSVLGDFQVLRPDGDYNGMIIDLIDYLRKKLSELSSQS